VKPWKAERLLHNVPSWSNAPAPKDALELDVGAYDARLGLAYGEVAALSRSQHKSQGFGVAGERGKLVERFVVVDGSRPGRDILDGIDVGWGRLGKAAAPFAKAIDEARASLDRDRPERALPALARAHAALAALPDEPRVREARRALEATMLAAAGVYVRATAPTPLGVPGGAVDVSVEIVPRSPAAVRLGSVSIGDAKVDVDAALAQGEKRVVAVKATLPDAAPISVPYWLEDAPLAGRHPVRDATLVGAPRTPPALVAAVALKLAGRSLRVDAPVVYAWTDAVHGERTRAFLIAPPATVTPTRDAFLFPNGKAGAVLVRVRAARDGVRGDVELGLPAGWRASPAAAPVALARAGDETTVRFDVTPPAKARDAVTIAPAIRVDGRAWSFREDTIDHAHIPLQLVLQPATSLLVPLPLTVPRGTVGYVRGSGDTVPEDLAHVGVKVEELDDDTLRARDLDRFAAIVVGIRAYNTREAVRASHARLMDYVKRGGVVVVQYVTNNRLSPLQGPIGPCPIEIGRDRITDETAAMVPVDPKHPLLRGPNAVGAADYTGWVQERGIYFATTWDECYEPLFELADPGEQPLRGGTLVAKHGKGRYVYTGLAFFRQLPAGVPGAYRLFANLIARK
jgi:hypothetical protein